MAPTPWPAPTATAPVDAGVPVPGSKSITNRALVIAALADGPSLLRRPLRARDTELMAEGLRALGAGVHDDREDDREDDEEGAWRVTPLPPGGDGGPVAVDCGLAGTVMRFLPPVAALRVGTARFDGDARARERPMQPVLDALRSLGVGLDDGGRGGLPFTVHGTGSVPGGRVSLDASSSSQFVTGLILSGCRFDQGLTVRHEGPPVPSRPHLAMTLAMLAEAGVRADSPAPDTWRVAPGRPRARDLDVEPDLSNAAPFLAAAVVTSGTVRIPGWPSASTQPGWRLPGLLERMGAGAAVLEAGTLTLTGGGRVRGIDADLREVGELVPVLAAVAALAESPSVLRGVAHLRGHETDRLAALAKEINALGGDVAETDDGLEIRPRPLHGGPVETYDDHRLAMAAAVLGLVVPGVRVVDVDTTAKTLPGFPARWLRMLGRGS